MSTFHDERRYAPAVREWHSDGTGPTAQHNAHQAEAHDRAALARILFAESWSIHEIAQYLQCPRGFVLDVVQDGLW